MNIFFFYVSYYVEVFSRIGYVGLYSLSIEKLGQNDYCEFEVSFYYKVLGLQEL